METVESYEVHVEEGAIGDRDGNTTMGMKTWTAFGSFLIVFFGALSLWILEYQLDKLLTFGVLLVISTFTSVIVILTFYYIQNRTDAHQEWASVTMIGGLLLGLISMILIKLPELSADMIIVDRARYNELIVLIGVNLISGLYRAALEALFISAIFHGIIKYYPSIAFPNKYSGIINGYMLLFYYNIFFGLFDGHIITPIDDIAVALEIVVKTAIVDSLVRFAVAAYIGGEMLSHRYPGSQIPQHVAWIGVKAAGVLWLYYFCTGVFVDDLLHRITKEEADPHLIQFITLGFLLLIFTIMALSFMIGIRIVVIKPFKVVGYHVAAVEDFEALDKNISEELGIEVDEYDEDLMN